MGGRGDTERRKIPSGRLPRVSPQPHENKAVVTKTLLDDIVRQRYRLLQTHRAYYGLNARRTPRRRSLGWCCAQRANSPWG